MRVVLVARDLLFASRLEPIATAAGASFKRVDHPGLIPSSDEIDLLLVDWGERHSEWAAAVKARSPRPGQRTIVFGPHTDLEAHAAAREAGLGPMRARSWVLEQFPSLLGRQG